MRPGTTTMIGTSILGNEAMMGVIRAEWILREARALWTTRKSVVQ